MLYALPRPPAQGGGQKAGRTQSKEKDRKNKTGESRVKIRRVTNNSGKIKRLRESLSEVARGFAGWEFDGGRAEANTEINRLQLFFDIAPDKQQCAVLKASGFKWAPSQGAWQRQLTDNAIYAAGQIDFIKPLDGRTVREHQPKPPAPDAVA